MKKEFKKVKKDSIAKEIKDRQKRFEKKIITRGLNNKGGEN